MKYVSAIDRRNFLRFSLGAGAGLAAAGMPHSLLAQQTVAENKKDRKERKKSVICLWMGGGPSHIDTFDPKPGTPNGGEFKAINAAPGMQLGELLPKTAAQGKHLTILRSVATGEGSHERGRDILHLGMTAIPGLQIPTIGTVISYENGRKDFPLPHYVCMSPPPIPMGNAFGDEYLPFAIQQGRTPIPNIQSSVPKSQDRTRAKLLLDQNADWGATRKQSLVDKVKKAYVKSEDVMTTPLMKAFDLNQESSATRAKYGSGRFGTNCLLARRLAEAGVSYIEIGLGGWDTHNDNFNRLRRLVPQVDGGLGGLLEDLADHEMLDDVVVMWMGEFGRTPNVNGTRGRDHWARGFSVVLSGGAVRRRGYAYGSTGPSGMGCIKPISTKKLMATIYKAAGVDTRKSYVTEGRKVKYAYEQPIRDIF